MDLVFSPFAATLEPRTFLSMVAGIIAGVVGGAIPGITITMTVILTLPFTFGMDPLRGLATMVGVYVGGCAGGLVSACLIGIPGTPSAIATTFDGFPMARKGEAGRAVWLGIWASCLGGLLAAIPLIIGATQLAYLAVNFGPWEYFSLFILTLSIVASLSEQSLVKGLIAGVFGLLVTTIGSDPLMAVPRFTFGWEFLRSGFPFLPILIGVFGLSQIMRDVEKSGAAQSAGRPGRSANLSVSHLAVIREILGQPVNLIRSSLIGLWIGILPAVGGSAANILAYDQAKKASRHPERFGTGIPDGIIASESSNNANVGGSLITMMAFGIPGDAVTAVMLGALIIHGIQPGPLFVTTNAPIAYGMFAAYILAHPLMVIIEGLVLRFALRVVNLPLHILSPIILVLCVVGSYALNNIIENVWTFALFGVLGYLMVKTGFPLAPLILGVILGDQLETNYIRAFMTDANWTLFFRRPVSGVMLAVALLSFGYSLWQRRRAALREAARAVKGEGDLEF
ncbi:MAG TPA: tripartite tricarboxylate transporter permease [Candidatus Methylomirabilis sp.]|nr:tripartite tricarboxylate transporter permease [Candidatus Methylomirabilis sp.]